MFATELQSANLRTRLGKYAETLRETGAIRSNNVHKAFESIPRHLFLPSFYYGRDLYSQVSGQPPNDGLLDIVYANHALVTRNGTDGEPPSSSSTPSLMAKMLEALDLEPGMRVLEIGAGTGYNAALIASITGGPVHTIEAGKTAACDAQRVLSEMGLDDQITVLHRDGYLGDVQSPGWDRIIVTCGIAGIPPAWLRQLSPTGVILAPIAFSGAHPIMSSNPLARACPGTSCSGPTSCPPPGHCVPTNCSSTIHIFRSTVTWPGRLRPFLKALSSGTSTAP